MNKVNILGTEYTIVTHKISEDEYLEKITLQDIVMKWKQR